MLHFGTNIEAFIQHAPAAVSLRAILQRLLPAEKLAPPFNNTVENQYERTLLFGGRARC